MLALREGERENNRITLHWAEQEMYVRNVKKKKVRDKERMD